ncbi:hypothetical protein GCM10011506_44400 [Marivirga lumbricoides]|uniref:Pyrrolo-quinoline quinone repeat domain-containing protein n=1 Tax=Marivirga lumbricoides TaxID=1046115 RepID=A0ABQ1N505_9BACT|nr:hypothetical protein GCM10011506_44400 [Marivirga lumbricoides]
MKILSILVGLLLFKAFSVDQKSPEPISNFLKLKWEVEIETKYTSPAMSGQYLLTADNFAIDAKTGRKLSFPISGEALKDSLLVYDNEEKLQIINIKVGSQVLNNIRGRTRYVGKELVDATNDSIWIEVDYKMNTEAFNIYNQKKIWSTSSPSQIIFKPIIHDNNVFIVNKDEILVLNKNNGKILYKIPTGGQVLSRLVFQGKYLYFIVRDNGFVAYNLDKKTVDWKFNMESYSGHINKIIINNDTIYFADSNLYAINREDGSLIWKLGSEKGVFIRRPNHLTLVNGHLVFYDFEDNEYELTVADKDTGEILYQGSNSTVVGGNRDNPDGVAKEDLLLIDFMDELIDDNILIGVMDNKIYGLEILK